MKIDQDSNLMQSTRVMSCFTAFQLYYLTHWAPDSIGHSSPPKCHVLIGMLDHHEHLIVEMICTLNSFS